MRRFVLLFGALALLLVCFWGLDDRGRADKAPLADVASPGAAGASAREVDSPLRHVGGMEVQRSAAPVPLRIEALDAESGSRVLGAAGVLRASEYEARLGRTPEGVLTVVRSDVERAASIEIGAEGYADEILERSDLEALLAHPAEPLRVPLTPLPVLRGRCEFSDGSPAAGALVAICDEGDHRWRCLEAGGRACVDSARVGEEGRFELSLPSSLAHPWIVVLGAGAYLDQARLDPREATAAPLRLVCSRARAAAIELVWPEGRRPFPGPGEGSTFTHSRINLAIEAGGAMEIPPAFERFYLPDPEADGAAPPRRFISVLGQAAGDGNAGPGPMAIAEVKLPGYQRVRRKEPIDLTELAPFEFEVRLRPDGPEPGRVELEFDVPERVPVPTGLGRDLWVRFLGPDGGDVVDAAVIIRRAPSRHVINGVPPGDYELLWRPAFFTGPWRPLLGENRREVTVRPGATLTLEVPRESMCWWVFDGAAVEGDPSMETVRLHASDSAASGAKEAFRGEFSGVSFARQPELAIPLQSARSYRAVFVGNPFYASDGSVVPFAGSDETRIRFSTPVLFGGDVEVLGLSRF